MLRTLFSISLLALTPAPAETSPPAAEAVAAEAVAPAAAAPAKESSPDLSLQMEIERGIQRGVAFLEANQAADGSWSDPQLPAFTALALSAILGDPDPEFAPGEWPKSLTHGFAYLMASQQPDGGFYREKLPNYNTALSLMALVASGQPQHHAAMRRARGFLIGHQANYGNPETIEAPQDGGIGYGSDPSHSDLSNTHLALEALAYSRAVLADSPGGTGATELNWDAAIAFVSACQNLPETNDQPYVSDDPAERGGFMYYPGDSKAGAVEGAANGAQRSYGSMTYAGLLSFLYAEVDRQDPRVNAALEWIGRTYSVSENPAMGQQGYYYYLHTMAKALRAAQVAQITSADGKNHDWREELALQILRLQAADGSWVNAAEPRWMEDNPVLVTAYAVLALEHIHRSL